jgi:hypothetical protein
MKVTIFGCGPAGLLAAHAAEQRGCEVTVISRRVRSRIHGAQYIHEEIPDLCTADSVQTISYAKLGNSSGYADKVYGSPLAPTSWAEFPMGEAPAWPMAGAYALLWSRWSSRVREADVNMAMVEGMISLAEDDEVFFSSIPLPSLCQRGHDFKSAPVVFEPECYIEAPDVIVYSGRSSEPWYRTSNLFGHKWTEYPARFWDLKALPDDWRYGFKPVGHGCDCLDSFRHLFRIGRFGSWSKRVLVSDAYKRAGEEIDALL